MAAQCYIDLARLLATGARSFSPHAAPLYSDITLIAPDGRQLKCHQMVLAACSKRLATVLKSGSFTGQKLPVQGVDSEALDTLIEAFYTGECPLSLGSAVAVFDAAVKLEVNGLPAAVEEFVGAALSPSNAVPLLQAALEAKTRRLVELCLGYVRSRLSEVVSGPEFTSCGLEAAGGCSCCR